ncbi:GTP-binding protein rhb1 [Zancudomyces culisetae]|uniref:GTP-binding protein rhb1 n=1 Tax=Zancudomyces culisetae TaxID=1213189 RepID=A0A1R1PPN0_ZANCU|nr:GTP-binding protein rhb1 [Zancudomyces culisetae]OMH82909.1 GTP-binding protein rhb1 [Zancudomyces culisetae]|eukprot:OMH81830.1 GTP-binding protein rhb1 [Zancudomyces culisetae]
MLGSIHDKILDATGVESIPMVLVGSKNDLSTQRQVSEKEATALSKTFKCSYVECSAKNKTNIDKIFQMAVSDLDKFNNPSAETGDDQQKAATCTLM